MSNIQGVVWHLTCTDFLYFIVLLSKSWLCNIHLYSVLLTLMENVMPRSLTIHLFNWQTFHIITRSIWKMLAHSPQRAAAPPHANSPDVASSTVARCLRIDVHNNDDNDNEWQRGPLWPHGMGPMITHTAMPVVYDFTLQHIKFISQRLVQLQTLSRSSCNSRVSIQLFTGLNSLVSSANFSTVLDRPLSKSFMKMRNRIGPSTDLA